jgi:hypothetical protein
MSRRKGHEVGESAEGKVRVLYVEMTGNNQILRLRDN